MTLSDVLDDLIVRYDLARNAPERKLLSKGICSLVNLLTLYNPELGAEYKTRHTPSFGNRYTTRQFTAAHRAALSRGAKAMSPEKRANVNTARTAAIRARVAKQRLDKSAAQRVDSSP